MHIVTCSGDDPGHSICECDVTAGSFCKCVAVKHSTFSADAEEHCPGWKWTNFSKWHVAVRHNVICLSLRA